MNIIVHIDQLVLDGVPVAPHERSLLQAAIQAELTRLLSEGGISEMLQAGGAVPAIAGGSIELGAGQQSDKLGQSIAQAAYSGIGTKA